MSFAVLIMVLFATIAILVVAAIFGVLLRHVVGPVLDGVIRSIQFIGMVIIELIGDLVAACCHLVVAVFMFPLIIGALALGRWESVSRMSRGLTARFRRVGRRVGGLVTRSTSPVLRSPRPRGKPGEFPGWRIVGQLQSGGSGAALHIAEPTSEAPADAPDRVVIKCFDTSKGAPLGHMIRESRALEGAKKLGLIIEHDHDEQRFWYVMPFIPGTHLADTVVSLHSDHATLGGGDLSLALGWQRDLLAVLRTYHEAGVWHKDVKPENIITNDTGAHLVDFGLVTPLHSAMTLTTHGTEYFRDPELVRQALRGAKVSEVDGARFDIYSAGAVLYYMVEGTFPAHGNLSRFDREDGDAIRWVIRRAMADYHQRYESIDVMLADVTYLAGVSDPRSVRPADLPSFDGSTIEARPLGAPVALSGAVASAARPRIEVADWWSGAYRVKDAVPGSKPQQPDAFSAARQNREAARMAREARRSARRAKRRASMGGALAFLVGVLVLTGGYMAVTTLGQPAINEPVAVAMQFRDALPSGRGQALIISDHPRRLDAMTRVAGQLQDGGWESTADAFLEAEFRRGLPVNGTASADFQQLARLVMQEHDLAAAAMVVAPEDDPDGVEVVFVTSEGMKTYRLPGLAAESTDVQSSP